MKIDLTNIKQLEDRRAELVRENAALVGKENINEADRMAFDANEVELTTVKAHIDRIHQQWDRERKAARLDASEGSGLENGGFASLGDFMSALFRKTKGDFDHRLRALQISAAAMNESVPSQGGFAVPPQFVWDALQPKEGDGAVLLNLCDRIQMVSNEVHAPGFADDSHSSTAPYGITWATVPESGSFGDAQVLPFKKIQLTAHKSGALFAASNEWLADSPMRSRIENIFRTSLRWYVEKRLWTGSGAGQALGALNAGATLSIAKETGQAAATIYTENIVKMWARLYPGSHSRAIWVANQTCFPQLATLTVGVGTGGALTGLLQTNRGVAGEPASAIFGRPLYFSEHLPALGSAGDIMLLDPMLYLLGDRQQISLDASEHVRFTFAETTFRVLARFDGQPALASVLTPANGDTLAWAVKIAART